MSILRFLNSQGIAGFAASICLALLLVLQKGETRHWKKQSGQLEQLYIAGQATLAGTIANYRSAAETARAADRANADRVAAEQRAINERTQNDFESRLAAARTRAGQLRLAAQAPADPGHGRAAPVPGLPAASGRASEAPVEGRLPAPDTLTATEQAIQLDELIKWVRAQAKVDAGTSH
jgi:hypothetical protein